MLGLMIGNGMHAILFVHCYFASQRISATVSSYMTWNGNTMETVSISKFYVSVRFHFS